MKRILLTRLGLAALLSVGLALPELAFAGMSPVGLSTGADAVDPLVIHVKKWKGKNWKGKNWARNRHIYVGPRRVYVRGWQRRPYYGRVIGGVALGTIIIAGAVPRAPSPDLCWYWTSPARNRGYWDYCY